MSTKKKTGLPKAVAKKVVQHTAYKAQAQSKRAGEDLRNTADGESSTEEYAQEKVEDSAKETAYSAGDFTFQATKLPYRAYRQALQKRQAENAIISEEASLPKARDTAEAAMPEATSKRQRYRRKLAQNKAVQAQARRKAIQNPVTDSPRHAQPDWRQQFRKRQIQVKAVRSKIAEAEARRTGARALPTPKLPKSTSKPIREQLQRMANYLLGKL